MHVWDDDTACADIAGNNSAFQADVPVVHEWTSGRFVRLKLVRSQSAALLTSAICPTTSIHLQSPCELFKFVSHTQAHAHTRAHTYKHAHTFLCTNVHTFARTHTHARVKINITTVYTLIHTLTHRGIHKHACTHTHTLVHTHSVCISILTHTTFWNSPQAIKWVETAIECFLLFTHCAVY